VLYTLEAFDPPLQSDAPLHIVADFKVFIAHKMGTLNESLAFVWQTFDKLTQLRSFSACVERMPHPSTRVLSASRTEGSVEVASMFLRLWCNAYARRLQAEPRAKDLRKEFRRLAAVSPGLRWQEDTARAAQPEGTRLVCRDLAEYLAKFMTSDADSFSVSPKVWDTMDTELARANCFVQDDTTRRVFRPCAARVPPSQAHRAAESLCNYAAMRALKRSQENLLLEMGLGGVDAMVDEQDLKYDSEGKDSDDTDSDDGSDSDGSVSPPPARQREHPPRAPLDWATLQLCYERKQTVKSRRRLAHLLEGEGA